MFRIVTRHIILTLLVIAGASSGYSQMAAPSPVESLPTLSDSVRQTTWKTVNGKSLKLSDFSNQVVLINIWATWCGPCRLEMPHLSQLYKQYKSHGLVVLGLAMDYNEQNDIKRVRDYLKKRSIKYKSIWDDGTLAVALVEAVQGRQVIPQTFVIGKDGRIVKHFSGFNLQNTPPLQRAAVEEALKNP